MRKLALVLSAIVVVLALAVVLGPRLVGLNAVKPQIAEAAREATGRDLTIEGDIDLAILPAVTFSASGIALANPEGMTEANLLSVGSIEGELALAPLLSGKIEVVRLIIRKPEIALEVDAEGRTSWEMPPSEPSEEGPPELALHEVRLEEGRIVYLDAASGQKIEARDIAVDVTMPSADRPLKLTGSMALNEEPVEFELNLDSLAGLTAGSPTDLGAKIASALINFSFQGAVTQAAAPSLDGDLDLDIGSVGKLAAWLGQPLDAAQPDPGPLKLTASFAADGGKMSLKRQRSRARPCRPRQAEASMAAGRCRRWR